MTQTQQTQTLTGLSFRVQLPEGGPQQLLVDSDRVLIGSGAHCEIRLPIDQARVEHVLIELGPAGVAVVSIMALFVTILGFKEPRPSTPHDEDVDLFHRTLWGLR